MSYGAQVSDASKDAYGFILNGLYRYATFEVKDEKEIVLVKTGERGESYQQFLEVLKEGGPRECRYGIYDFGEPSLKKLLLVWCPETVTMKKYAMYTGYAATLRDAVSNIRDMRAVEVRNEDDLEEDDIKRSL